MQYKFMEKMNFEDLSGGRVIYSKAGFTNFSARLTCEIFMRCLEVSSIKDRKVSVYDPCCGGGYLLTVLGFMCNGRIESLYGSDISIEAVALADANLRLLTNEGLNKRRNELELIYDTYGKDSHYQALKSAENLLERIPLAINYKTFKRDILDAAEENMLAKKGHLADIIMADIPYGVLTKWSDDRPFAINKMLDNLFGDLNNDAVIAIITDKRQKISAHQYKRIEKFQIGKRKIEILKRRD